MSKTFSIEVILRAMTNVQYVNMLIFLHDSKDDAVDMGFTAKK